MNRKDAISIYPSQIFMSIKEASICTGLSQHYIREGCKNGNLPCIKSGQKYLVDIPKMLDVLRCAEDKEDSSNE